MTKAEKKIYRAINSTSEWLANVEKRAGHKQPEICSENGLTIYGCELRNVEEYKEMLKVKDKRKLKGRLRELFIAID